MKVLDKTEEELAKRGVAGAGSKKRKFFRQKVSLKDVLTVNSSHFLGETFDQLSDSCPEQK